jgi:hypothetical protein
MTRIRAMLTGLYVGLLCSAPAIGRTIDVEFLQGAIGPKNIEDLDGLACRNYDHIVHIDITVGWPDDKLDQEFDDYKRLIFWNDNAEYLFPSGSYFFLHGDYMINGYFIPRRGGMHQGIISIAFEKIDDAQVLLNPNVNEAKAKGPGC